MKWIAALALILLAGCASGPQPLLLTFHDGTCSGTAIAQHALLTATHCMDGKRDVMADGAPMTVLGRMDDGNDHTILIVGQSFDAHATFAPVPDLG